MSLRPVRRMVQSRSTMEGAGVRLHRAFGFGETEEFDPFLLFDDFRGERPADYRAGFPWHPHRGIETITYVLAGRVTHGDSMGNHGTISAGDVQWMTAGRGIIHQEMPEGDADGRMYGFQLWANLPATYKMTAPRYQDVASDSIPEAVDSDGTKVRVVCGRYREVTGPVQGIAADPTYLDVSVPPAVLKTFPVEKSLHAFAYVFEGSGTFGGTPAPPAENRSLVLFDAGDEVAVEAGPAGIRFLLISGKPLREPVAWRGPIVMNTQEELRRAFDELERGTFLQGG